MGNIPCQRPQIIPPLDRPDLKTIKNQLTKLLALPCMSIMGHGSAAEDHVSAVPCELTLNL